MRRNRLIATIAAGLGVVALIPVATALGDGNDDGQGATIEAVTALGTGFTYQGRLTDAGNPANGTYDIRFILWDADTGGAQVGATQSKEDVVVTNGLFTVDLDFGASAFNGDARWVEIAVRAGASTGVHTVLSPRQAVSPAPYALFAKAAGGIAVPFAATGTLAGSGTTGLFTVTQTGTGVAIAGNRTSTDAAVFPGVLGTNSGAGAGVQGESTYTGAGVGVRGIAVGAGSVGGEFSGEIGIDVDGPIRVSGDKSAFVHTVTGPNSTVASCATNDHCTFIDNQLINNDPDALLFVTQRYNEGESNTGVNNPQPVGVWYEPTLDKWVIFNEDTTVAMPVGAKFNVLVIKQ